MSKEVADAFDESSSAIWKMANPTAPMMQIIISMSMIVSLFKSFGFFMFLPMSLINSYKLKSLPIK